MLKLILSDDEKSALLKACRIGLNYTDTSNIDIQHLRTLWPKLGGDPKEIKNGGS